MWRMFKTNFLMALSACPHVEILQITRDDIERLENERVDTHNQPMQNTLADPIESEFATHSTQDSPLWAFLWEVGVWGRACACVCGEGWERRPQS